MDGLTFVEHLRREGSDIPVIITSAFNEAEYLTKAIDLKVDKFINKPIRITDLMDILTKLAQTIFDKRQLRIKQQELKYYRQAMEQTNFVMHIRPDGSLLGMNRDLSEYFGEVLGKDFSVRSIDEILEKGYVEELLDKVKELKVFSKMALLTIDGISFTIWITAFASILEEECIAEITLLLTNISEVVREKDETIERLYTDDVTGLPNRQKLFHDLAEYKSNRMIMIVDIDGFSNLNHLYGFDMGDDILRQMATVLADYGHDKEACYLYRSDVDHFVILFENREPFL